MLSVTKKPFMLNVVMLSVVKLNAEAGSQANRTNRPSLGENLITLPIIVKRVSWFKSSLLLRIQNKHKHKH